MKKLIAICLFFSAGLCLQAQNLSWDIKFLKGKEQESLSVSRMIRMENGDFFQAAITPALDCYCYAVYFDSARQVMLLNDQPLKGGKEVFLEPAPLMSAIMLEDPPGTDTLYVIMSLEREAELEKLIQNYKNNPGLRQSTDNLEREIIRLQTTVSGVGEPTSKWIPGGVSTRGNTEQYVTRFTDKKMYVRPITIRH